MTTEIIFKNKKLSVQTTEFNGNTHVDLIYAGSEEISDLLEPYHNEILMLILINQL